MHPRFEDYLYQIKDFDPQNDDWWELIDMIDDIWSPEDSVRQERKRDLFLTLHVNQRDENKKIIKALQENTHGLWDLIWYSSDRTGIHKLRILNSWLPAPPHAEKYESDNNFPTIDGKHAIPQKDE